MLAPTLRLANPDALVGFPVVDTRGSAVGAVVGVIPGRGQRIEALAVRSEDGSTHLVDEDRIVALDPGRVVVRRA